MKKCPVCSCEFDGTVCPECKTIIETVQTSNLNTTSSNYDIEKLKKHTQELLNDMPTNVQPDSDDVFQYPFEPINNQKTCWMILSDIFVGLLITMILLFIILWFLWH